jgi:O-antigen/teichoic acid export membrane protein
LTAVLLPEGVLRAYADTRFILKVTFMKLAITLALIFPFLGWFGLQGGILTLVIVLALAKAVLLRKMSQLVPVPLAQILPWRDLLNLGVFSVLCGVPVLFVQGIDFSSHLVSLSVSVIVYLLFYLVFLFTSHLITFDEKREIVRIFRQMGQRIPAMSKF